MGTDTTPLNFDLSGDSSPLGGQRMHIQIQLKITGSVESAQKYLARVFHNGDAVLIKGSRRMRMEQVAEFLLASPKGGI